MSSTLDLLWIYVEETVALKKKTERIGYSESVEAIFRK